MIKKTYFVTGFVVIKIPGGKSLLVDRLLINVEFANTFRS